MYDIEIKKGHTFRSVVCLGLVNIISVSPLLWFSRYDIWFGGEPPPTVTWEREGTVIQPEPRITLELFSKKTVYCERNTVRNVEPFLLLISDFD